MLVPVSGTGMLAAAGATPVVAALFPMSLVGMPPLGKPETGCRESIMGPWMVRCLS